MVPCDITKFLKTGASSFFIIVKHTVAFIDIVKGEKIKMLH